MNKKILSRIILDLLMLIFLLNGWWFLALPLALIGAYLFPYFIEMIIAGIGYDALFGFISGIGLWKYAGTAISIVLFLGVVALKKTVRR